MPVGPKELMRPICEVEENFFKQLIDKIDSLLRKYYRGEETFRVFLGNSNQIPFTLNVQQRIKAAYTEGNDSWQNVHFSLVKFIVNFQQVKREWCVEFKK